MSSLVSVKRVAGAQLDRLRLDLADAHLGAGQVGHDGDALPGGALGGADARDALGVAGEVAVREVEPRDVQPGADEAFQHLRRFRGRPDGGDDLGLVVRQHMDPQESGLSFAATNTTGTKASSQSSGL